MKELTIRVLAVVLPGAIFASLLKDFAILVGAVLALASFYISQGTLRLVLKFPIVPAPIAAISLFFFRLFILAVVFYLLATLTQLNIVAVSASFIILYTLLLFLEMKLSASS